MAQHRLTSSTSSISRHVDLASDGTGTGVVYADRRTTTAVYFRRFDATGTPEGPEISLGDGSTPSIVWTGDRFVVAIQRGLSRNPGFWIDLVYLQPDGTVESTTTYPIHSPSIDYPELELVRSATGAFAVLVGDRYLSTQSWRFGVLGDPSVAPSFDYFDRDGDPRDATVAADPAGGYVVMYSSNFSIVYRRVEPDGSILSSPTTVLARGTGSTIYRMPHLLHDGTDFVFTFVEDLFTNESIELARGLTAGARARVAQATSSSAQALRYPRIARRGSQLLVTWQQFSPTATDTFRIDGRRYSLPPSGPPVAQDGVTQLLPTFTVDEHLHDAAWTGDSSATLGWIDLRWSQREVYAMGIVGPSCAP
jgi:hypothetical protein